MLHNKLFNGTVFNRGPRAAALKAFELVWHRNFDLFSCVLNVN